MKINEEINILVIGCIYLYNDYEFLRLLLLLSFLTHATQDILQKDRIMTL